MRVLSLLLVEVVNITGGTCLNLLLAYSPRGKILGKFAFTVARLFAVVIS